MPGAFDFGTAFTQNLEMRLIVLSFCGALGGYGDARNYARARSPGVLGCGWAARAYIHTSLCLARRRWAAAHRG